jgi:hypothetical protein
VLVHARDHGQQLSSVESTRTRTLVQQVLGEQLSSIRIYELEAHGAMQVNCDESLGASQIPSRSQHHEAPRQPLDEAYFKQASLSCCSYNSFRPDESRLWTGREGHSRSANLSETSMSCVTSQDNHLIMHTIDKPK